MLRMGKAALALRAEGRPPEPALSRSSDAIPSVLAQTDDWGALFEKAAFALEDMQTRLATAQSRMGKMEADSGRLADTYRRELDERDEKIASLKETVAGLEILAVVQNDAICDARVELVSLDEEIANLTQIVAHLQDRLAGARHVSEASPNEASQTIGSGCEGMLDDPILDRLQADQDVIRFKKHLELLVAA